MGPETINPISLIVTVASLSLVPLVAVTATSFLKISAVLLILRNAIGVQQVPSNMVLYGISMVITLLVMGPVLQDASQKFAPEGNLPGNGTEMISAIGSAIPPFKVFMLKHTNPDYHDSFYQTSLRISEKYQAPELDRNDLTVVLPAFVLFGNAQHLPSTDVQWLVLLFLGLCPTALGLYWWNKGACLVSGATLAVMNNLHVPVGLLLNLLIWNQHEPLGRLALGGLVILGAVWISRLGVKPVSGVQSAR